MEQRLDSMALNYLMVSAIGLQVYLSFAVFDLFQILYVPFEHENVIQLHIPNRRASENQQPQQFQKFDSDESQKLVGKLQCKRGRCKAEHLPEEQIASNPSAQGQLPKQPL